MESKNELIESWNQEIQKAGTLTVLHTNAIAAHVGISATEFEAIDVISRNQPITAGQLSTATGLTTGAITGLIDRLSAAGFVKRAKDPGDRRKVLIVPIENSERSKKVFQLYRPLYNAFIDEASQKTEAELQTLIMTQRSLNEKVQDIIENMHSDQ